MGKSDVVVVLDGGAHRLVLKRSYHPPYLWVQRWRPRARDWEVVAQMDCTAEMAARLEAMARLIREAVEDV